VQILTVNAGSSNVKLALFRIGARSGVPDRLAAAQAHRRGDAIELRLDDGPQAPGTVTLPVASPGGIEAALLAELDRRWPLASCAAVGHRIVHGGDRHAAPERLTPEVLAQLHRLADLAPLHQPPALAWVDAVARAWPGVDQVGCFDTAFHAGMPALARRFALPRALHDAGIRRYGFHGLSYASVARQLRERAPALATGRVVVAHLGSGCSACAMVDGRSIDTTMGFSALDGLPMATRCGSIDPGVLLHLLQQRGLSAQALSDLLYRQSGLLGVSGESGDVRDLLASRSAAAAEAIALFVHRCAQQVAGLACSLGGLDGLVFTGGVGEHQAAVRAAVAAALAWLGVRIDADGNRSGAARFDAAGSTVQLWRLASDEAAEIARGTGGLLAPVAPVG
jgi:acetate kinase